MLLAVPRSPVRCDPLDPGVFAQLDDLPVGPVSVTTGEEPPVLGRLAAGQLGDQRLQHVGQHERPVTGLGLGAGDDQLGPFGVDVAHQTVDNLAARNPRYRAMSAAIAPSSPSFARCSASTFSALAPSFFSLGLPALRSP